MLSVMVPVAASPEYLLRMSRSFNAAVLASVAVGKMLTRQLSVGFPSMSTIMFIVPTTSWTAISSPADSAWEHPAVAATLTARSPSFLENREKLLILAAVIIAMKLSV